MNNTTRQEDEKHMRDMREKDREKENKYSSKEWTCRSMVGKPARDVNHSCQRG